MLEVSCSHIQCVNNLCGRGEEDTFYYYEDIVRLGQLLETIDSCNCLCKFCNMADLGIYKFFLLSSS